MDIGKDLTKRQQEIFDFIKRTPRSYGYPPTVRDIGKAVGLASSSTVHAHLANLEKVGLLRRDPSKPRAIELLDRAATDAADAVKSVVGPGGLPLVGHVAAGQPILAEENIEDYVQVPRARRRRRGRVRAARARRLDEERRHPAGRLRGRAPAGHGERRRDRRRAAWARRRRSSASSGRPTTCACSRRTTTMEPIRSREVQVLGRVVGVLRKVA